MRCVVDRDPRLCEKHAQQPPAGGIENVEKLDYADSESFEPCRAVLGRGENAIFFWRSPVTPQARDIERDLVRFKNSSSYSHLSYRLALMTCSGIEAPV